MTLEELAERAKLPPNYVGSVEADRRDPSLSTVLALAAGLRVSPADLFGGRGEIGPIGLEAARLVEAAPPDELLRAVSKRRK